jgi:uncharacterized protein with HEPN domain
MPSRDIVLVFAAITHNIALARRFIEDISYETFVADERTLYAVTRCLEIISEAVRRLPDDLKARYPEVPWRRIAGAGNVYRHDYEDVLAGILWDTVRDHLHALENAVRQEQERLEED